MNKPYGALRFIASLIEYFGMVLIVAAWSWGIIWSVLVELDPHRAEVTINLLSSEPVIMSSPYFVLAVVFIFTFIGIVIVATGQIYKVFLEMRDDIHDSLLILEEREERHA